MATVICRRMRGGIYQASTFSSTVRWSKKRTPNGNGKCYTFHPAKGVPPSEETGNKMNRIDSQVLYNPSAYVGVTRLKGKRSEEYEDCPSENGYATSNAKQTQNTYSITCSRSLSSTKNNILDLAFSRQDQAQPKIEEKSKEVKENKEPIDFLSVIEAYSSKDDPRAFQQQRPEYQSLCYSSFLPNAATSVEEGQSLLQKVTVLKSSLTPAQISSFLEKLSYLPIEEIDVIRSSTKFSMLCRYSVENIQMFSTAELINILRSFTRLEVPPAHSMLNVYQAEFSRRVWNMTTDESLLVADMWRYLGRSVPQFLEILYSCMELRWKDLTLPQLVQLIYILGEGRRAPQELMQKLESMVLRYVDSINMEEIGTVCLGYFKSHSGLSEYLMRRFGDRVSQNMEEISNYALVNVLKMFRYTHVDHLPFLKRLGQEVPKRIPHMGVQGIMHIALSCTALHYLDENILNAVAAAVPSRLAFCRSKDLAKFLWSFGALNYEPPNAARFYGAFTEEIRKRLREFEMFPEHFLTSLMGLVFARQFPTDLLEVALSERFVEQATKNELFELKKDLFTIAGSVEIECPNYKGSQLPPGLRQEVTEMLESFASQDICTKPEVVEAAGLLESMLGGPQYVKNHMILPHTRSSDLEVHFDIRGKPLPINQDPAVPEVDKPDLKPLHIRLTDDLLHQILDRKTKCSVNTETVTPKPKQPDAVLNEATFSTQDNSSFAYGVPITEDLLSVLTKPKTLNEKPLSPPKLDVRKLAIQVSHRNHYCYASRHLLGLHNLKRRQLRRLGYVVIELPYWEWFPLMRRTRSEKLAYLHQKVYGSLNDHL